MRAGKTRPYTVVALFTQRPSVCQTRKDHNEEVLPCRHDHRGGGAALFVRPALRRARLRTFGLRGRVVSESGGVRAGRRSDTKRHARPDSLRTRGAGAGRARILGGGTRHTADRLFVRIAAVPLSQGVAYGS